MRSDVAMTGEITLSGLVLPVGGIREKTLAARRLGIRTIILPAMNEPDLEELPEDARKDMTFHPVTSLDRGARGRVPGGDTARLTAARACGRFLHLRPWLRPCLAPDRSASTRSARAGPISPSSCARRHRAGCSIARRAYRSRSSPATATPASSRSTASASTNRATIQRADAFYRTLDERARDEARAARATPTPGSSIADAPPLGCAAAAAAGVPSVVVTNFTWDWIYEGYPTELAARASAPARHSGRLPAAREAAWRLPMHGGFAPFDTIVDVPFIARHAHHPRDVVRRTLGLPLDRPLVLSSFGGYGVSGFDVSALDCLRRVRRRPDAS